MGLYCSSGAALAFAWRDYMPTFTDASLIAAGSGLLLWAVLATDAGLRRRTWAGLAGFVALELATFVRYTDIVILGCAAVAVIVGMAAASRGCPSAPSAGGLPRLPPSARARRLQRPSSTAAQLTTGYQPGEVTFSLHAIGPNLRLMPAHLMQAMPMLVLGLIALAWIIIRRLVLRRACSETGAEARRDLWVGITLAASWLAIWGLYSTYTWTTDPTNGASVTSGSTSPRLARSPCSAPGWSPGFPAVPGSEA